MLDKLIVVDYQEGAGGEYMANWLSAHFGHPLAENMQSNPNWLQKWFNSQRLVCADWNTNFSSYLSQFQKECTARAVTKIAVSYHLYHYPQHIEVFCAAGPTRFVRINCQDYLDKIYADFERKVSDRPLSSQDWPEVKFILQNQSPEHRAHCVKLFKQRKLTYRTLLPHCAERSLKVLPSQDIEVNYGDFFVQFDRTAQAYDDLCAQLDIEPQPQLLAALIKRNKKNLQFNST